VDNLPLFETDGFIEHHRISLTGWQEFLINLSHLSRKNYFPYIFEICKKLKDIKPDIIHVRSRPWFLPILRKYLGNEIKIIEHNHNNYFSEMRKGEVKKYLDQMDAFAGVSQFTANVEVLERFPEEKDRCFVIYNGANLDKFSPKNVPLPKIHQLKERFNINSGDIIVSYLGRLRKSKGVDILLKSVKKLIKEENLANLKLMLIGSNFFGGDKTVTPFMKQLARESQDIKNNVIFTGFIQREEIQDIYAVTDIVALPSLVQDASPNVCYEAQAMEVPIISSKRGGIPEIVKDGETALLVNDPEDVDELAKKILDFVRNEEKRKTFGKRGRKRIEENFTWEIAARRTEEMYDKVLSF
jgi:spore coat protein SA